MTDPVPGSAARRFEFLGMGTHPLVRGLLDMLPPEGTPFSAEQRDRWLNAFRANLRLLYPVDDDAEARRGI